MTPAGVVMWCDLVRAGLAFRPRALYAGASDVTMSIAQREVIGSQHAAERHQLGGASPPRSKRVPVAGQTSLRIASTGHRSDLWRPPGTAPARSPGGFGPPSVRTSDQRKDSSRKQESCALQSIVTMGHQGGTVYRSGITRTPV